jgi:single-strand DNA-binding protein
MPYFGFCVKHFIMIKLTVIGNLGKDAVVNNVNGKSVINFSVAHTEKIKDAQGNVKDKTIWVECAYWTDRTAIAPYLRKGTQVYAEGSPDLRNYTTQDGRTGTSLTLRIQQVQLLGGKSEGGASNGGNSGMAGNSYGANASAPAYNNNGGFSGGGAPMGGGADIEDDLPF